MEEFFAAIYETLLQIPHISGPYASQFYQTLFVEGGYVIMGLIFLVIPFICASVFYFIIKYPYLKYWHWLIAVLVTAVIVFLVTRSLGFEMLISNVSAAADPDYRKVALDLLVYFSFYNAFLGILFFSIYSLVLKQFSKAQAHLPI